MTVTNEDARSSVSTADPLISRHGDVVFRDLNGNGVLDPYEDPRLPASERADDLLARMTLAEKAGQMFHTIIQPAVEGVHEPADNDTDLPHDLLSTHQLVGVKLMTHFNTVMKGSPAEYAAWQNRVQRLAADTRLGIPVTFSTDPAHGFTDNPAAGSITAFSSWPEPIGLAATGDAGLVREFADIARQEYLFVGIRTALHPMADLATEPRWARLAGTFGADADVASAMIAAYIDGFQRGPSLGRESVACMTKHFPGAGPQLRGEDAHFPYGREQVYPGRNWEYHLRVFEAAFEAGTAQIMPYYAMPVGIDGVEEIGFGFNRDVVTGWLRERYGFSGVICSDWGIVSDVRVGDVRWPARAWGAEHLSRIERVKRILEAGCDQLGGESCPELVVELVESGAIAESRIDASVRRILLDKFRLGLFDDPYVDPDTAERTVGRADFIQAGRDAQRRSIVLLKNGDVGGKSLLPLAAGTRLHIEGVDPIVASTYGTIVDRSQADVVIRRLQAPFEDRSHTGVDYEHYFHAGSLEFPRERRDEILASLDGTPSVVSIFLDRPAVIPEIAGATTALLGEFGATDEALLDVVFGRHAPTASLPVELPSSMAEVERSREDVPGDTANPLYPYGAGMRYTDGKEQAV
ncbi:glycoside hydrolase family 3 N-terminal domain-containing protein [Paenarthrobacter nicotinovorans]|uniref:glycoside hydrolase family 3 protein n=1 Tax=Paenarthrobacter nicotinovorans TaxID=29320 RepID=UPI00374954A5